MSLATRAAFGKKIAELGSEFKDLVVLDADLAKSTQSKHFAKKFPDRFFEMGISEANMIGAAAGLALGGKIPFLCSFACFLTGRYDQIRISGAYSNANIKLVGTHSGIAIGEDGYSQMGLEDIALMKSLPNMAVIQPADSEETAQAVDFLTRVHKGPAYLRLTRQAVDDVSNKVEGYKFEFGKGVVHREGNDLAIIATGAVLQESLKASEMLVQSGINARVINIHTIKPIDEEIIIESAKKCSKVVTVEDHQLSAGFGESVNSVLSRNYPTKTFNIAVNDVFGESGSPSAIYKKYKLDAEGIREQITTWLNSN